MILELIVLLIVILSFGLIYVTIKQKNITPKEVNMKSTNNDLPKSVNLDVEINNNSKFNKEEKEVDYLIPEDEYDEVSEDFLLNPFAYQEENDEYFETVVIKNNSIARKRPSIQLVDKKTNHIDTITMNEDTLVIGRLKKDVDYHINESEISRIHALIDIREEKFYIKDLNSKNKTYINKYEIEPERFYELKDGYEIAFGDKEYVFKTKVN